MILIIRTDNPEADLRLIDAGNEVARVTWHAHRRLAETIHQKIDELLGSVHKTTEDLNAIICYKGPGSFTGLRIGISVGNSLAYSLDIPIVGSSGDNWIADGHKQLSSSSKQRIITPEYGREAHITQQKK